MKPVLQSLLIADHVYQDRASGKRIIAGVFNKLYFQRAVPAKKLLNPEGKEVDAVLGGAQAGSPSFYISLVGIHGRTPLSLRYVELKNSKVWFGLEFVVECRDPLEVVEIVLGLPPLPTPHEGVFALELLYDNEMLGSCRVTVEELPQQKVEGE